MILVNITLINTILSYFTAANSEVSLHLNLLLLLW